MVSDSYSMSYFLCIINSFILSSFWRRIVSISSVFGIGYSFTPEWCFSVPAKEAGFGFSGERLTSFFYIWAPLSIDSFLGSGLCSLLSFNRISSTVFRFIMSSYETLEKWIFGGRDSFVTRLLYFPSPKLGLCFAWLVS